MSATLNIDGGGNAINNLLAEVRQLGGAITGDEIRLIMGAAVKEEVQQHLYALSNDEGHHKTARSLGATPTGFYLHAADHTHDPQLEEQGVSVSIEQQGLAQRFYGGRIEGDPLLTIPARAEAYGKRASEFDNLRLIIWNQDGAGDGQFIGGLVERDATVVNPRRGGFKQTKGRAKGDAIGGGLFYFLARWVDQSADPDVLPDEGVVLDSALSAARNYIDRAWERKAA